MVLSGQNLSSDIGVERVLARLRAARRSTGLTFASWTDFRLSLRSLLSEFSDDATTLYGRRGIILESVLTELQIHWDRRHTLERTDRAAVGLALLIAGGVAASSEYSTEGRPPRESEDAHARRMNGILEDRAVKALLRSMYRPAANRRTPESWRRIDWLTLRFYRAGTTSMIMRAESDDGPVAVKLLHFLFREIRPIAEAMRTHAGRSERIRADCGYLPRAYGSGDGWQIDEFIDGLTLADYIGAEVKRVNTYEERIELFRRTYCGVLSAVASLHDANDGTVTHADLSPANILVQTGGTWPGEVNLDATRYHTERIRLIDLGRNLLASSAIGRVSSPDAHFVAPEVAKLSPEGSAETQSADYYSLGVLVPMCAGISSPRDLRADRLPDALFRFEPILAVVATDLSDPSPGRRFGLIGDANASSGTKLRQLRDDLLEVAAALADGTEISGGASANVSTTASDAVHLRVREVFASARRAAKGLRGASLPLGREHARFRFWLRVAAISLCLSLALIVFTISLDYPDQLGWWIPPPVTSFAMDTLGYEVRRRVNWEARLIGLSFALACFYYYVLGFARFTMRNAGGGAYFKIGEISVRLMTVVVLPFVLLGTLWVPGLWLWFSVAGMGLVAFNNWIVNEQVNSVIRRCALVAALPGGDRRRSGTFWESVEPSRVLRMWAPSLGLYVVVVAFLACWVTWIGDQDTLLLAVVLAILNVVFFAWAQAVRQGPELYGEITRAAIFGERLARVVGSA